MDQLRTAAKKAIEHYLSLPVLQPDDPETPDTFAFWKNHCWTTDKAQKGLCHLARLYLTPPPTSTGKNQGRPIKGQKMKQFQ